MNSKIRIALALGLPLLLADCATKSLAVSQLSPHLPHEVLGDFFRFTLTYNTGAAMGLSLGGWSRVGFAAIAIAEVLVLGYLLRQARPSDKLRAAAIGLIVGGALGNLADRLRWERGVVDFIDFGLGSARFWTFNLADMGVDLGAALLILVLMREEKRERLKQAAAR